MELYRVESGNETWDYDMPDGMPPMRHVDDYMVMLGNKLVKRFTVADEAVAFAKKMNSVSERGEG